MCNLHPVKALWETVQEQTVQEISDAVWRQVFVLLPIDQDDILRNGCSQAGLDSSWENKDCVPSEGQEEDSQQEEVRC